MILPLSNNQLKKLAPLAYGLESELSVLGEQKDNQKLIEHECHNLVILCWCVDGSVMTLMVPMMRIVFRYT